MVRSNAREDKVLLSSIQSLTFQDGKLTKARRSKPIRESSLAATHAVSDSVAHELLSSQLN